MSNFIFLKKKNNNLFKIISEAEQLFRDEYFEQVMVQTRRFAENLCRDLLEDKVSKEDTFDDIINKIKDNSFENTRMQELVKDLYFIKKNGNNSAHSGSSNKDGEIALECLECAFEISIYYSHAKFGYDEKLDKTQFSEELLITGQQTQTKTLKEKYVEALNEERNNNKERVIKTVKNKTTQKKKTPKAKSQPKIRMSKISKVTVKSSNSNVVKIIFVSLLLLILIIIGLFIYKYQG